MRESLNPERRRGDGNRSGREGLMRGCGVGVRHTGLCMPQKAPTASDWQVITWGAGKWIRWCRESGGTEAVQGSRFHIKCNSLANLKNACF